VTVDDESRRWIGALRVLENGEIVGKETRLSSGAVGGEVVGARGDGEDEGRWRTCLEGGPS
jgi:hypothetical protein